MVKKSLFARLFNRSETNGDRKGVAPAARPAMASRPSVDSRTKEPSSRNRVKDLDRSRSEDVLGRRRVVEEAESEQTTPEPADRTGAKGVRSVEVREPPMMAAEPLESKPANGPPIRASEMPRQEEINLKLKEGFQGISSVLSGIDRKIDRHQQTSNDLMVTVRKIPEMMKDVPDASKAGLELLATISAILENQGRATNELLAKLGGLPEAMEEFEARFQDQLQAQVENLSKSGSEAEKVARDTQHKVAAAFSDVRSKVDELSTRQARRQDEMLREMRRQQAQQERRVDELLKRSGSTTKLVVFLLFVVIAALLLVVHQVSG